MDLGQFAGGPVRVECVDILGRVVRILYEGQLNAGSAKMNGNLGGLANGEYVIRLTSGDLRLDHPIIVAH